MSKVKKILMCLTMATVFTIGGFAFGTVDEAEAACASRLPVWCDD
ncbi:hypothetical protein [Bacillus solimangrovi]|nr:hypothetical protein [Bacillus solimangrovi]